MKYYMHGVGHYLGLDVHDAGRYFIDQRPRIPGRSLPEWCLTVEPGIYIPPDDKSAPSKYRGIGIRIEDDVLVTENGNVNLTSKVPKDPDEIEAMMAKSKMSVSEILKHLPLIFASIFVAITFHAVGPRQGVQLRGQHGVAEGPLF